MNRVDLLRFLGSLRSGAPIIIGPGLSNYPIADAADDPLTIYNMDMPYATPIALGIALAWPDRKVVSIEGDGSMLAGPGVLTTIGRYQPRNLIVMVFDNQAYLTTGSGLALTATACGTSIELLGKAAGIALSRTLTELSDAQRAVEQAFTEPGPWLLVNRVDTSDRQQSGARGELPVDVFEAGLRFRRAALQARG
jgi:sulfopyruvate decarboxylase subunit beta